MAERSVLSLARCSRTTRSIVPRRPSQPQHRLEQWRRHSRTAPSQSSHHHVKQLTIAPRRPTTFWRPSSYQSARSFTTTPQPRHGDLTPPKPGQERHVTFITKEGSSHTFEVADGDNLLDIAQANDLEMEGACGGSCACSTCHVVVEGDEMYDKMEEPSDDENDMLDLAFGLTETSRLGCQVVMSKELDGMVVCTNATPLRLTC